MGEMVSTILGELPTGFAWQNTFNLPVSHLKDPSELSRYLLITDTLNVAGYVLSPLVGVVRIAVHAFFLSQLNSSSSLSDEQKKHLAVQIGRGVAEICGGGYLFAIVDTVMGIYASREKFLNTDLFKKPELPDEGDEGSLVYFGFAAFPIQLEVDDSSAPHQYVVLTNALNVAGYYPAVGQVSGVVRILMALYFGFSAANSLESDQVNCLIVQVVRGGGEVAGFGVAFAALDGIAMLYRSFAASE